MTDASEPPHPPYLRVLGLPTVIRPGESPIEFSVIQRRILARLAIDAPRQVSLDELVQAAWDADPPPTAKQAIQNQISRIRRGVLTAMADLITTAGVGYALTGATDAQLLIDGAKAAEQQLAAGDPQTAYNRADAALELWHGEPFAEIANVAGVSGYRSACRAARDGALDLRLEAAIQLGMRAWSHAEAERLVARSPLDERRSALLARALALTGRRGDALAAISETRRRLRTELGIESGPYLEAAAYDILSGAAALGAPVLGATRSGVSVLGAGSRGGTSIRRNAPPLVGRDAALRAILRTVAQRRPVRVRGEHGSGVSRILFEVRTRLMALGVTVVLVRAEQHPASAMSLIEEILAELDTPVKHSHSALTVFTSAINTVDPAAPVAVIVDDAHLLGPSAWQAIHTAVAAQNVAVVLGSHGHVVDILDDVEVVLEPLDSESVSAIARSHGVTDPDVAAWLTDHSGGNPLGVKALANMFTENPSMTESPLVAPSVKTWVDRLIDHLDSDTRRDLELAAVAADGYPFAAFKHLALPRPAAPPKELVDTDAAGAVRFRHGAVRALIYQELPRAVAADLHHALGIAAQKAGAPAATAARHLIAAAGLDPEAAIASACDAARAASALGAHADAAEWLAAALAVDLPSDPARTIAISIEHADALRLAGNPDHLDALMAATRSALDFGGDALIAAAGFALLQLGGSTPAGEPNLAITELAQQVTSSIADPQERAVVQAAASLAWSMTGNAELSRQLFDEAEAAAVDTAARLRVLPFSYLAVGRPADLPRRAALAAELITLARAADEPAALFEGLHLQFSVALQYGGGAAARECLREMESLIGRVGDVGRRWAVLYCSATVAEWAGDLAQCEQLAGEAHAMFAEVSPERAAAAYYAQLLPLRVQQGRLAELRPTVEALVTDQSGVTAWHAAAALVLAATIGDPAADDPAVDAPIAHDPVREKARTHAERALELAQDDFTWLAAHVVGGRAAAMLGDIELARRYAEQLEPWADVVCWQGTCSYGPVADVLAQLAAVLGDPQSAAKYRGRAAKLVTSLAP